MCNKHYQRWSRHGDPRIGSKAHLKPDCLSTTVDLYWAAGFLEGEGCFLGDHSAVRASQVNKEPLDKLRSFLGGSVNKRKRKLPQQDVYEWNVSGVRARGVMMTLYSLMSEDKKKDIRSML